MPRADSDSQGVPETPPRGASLWIDGPLPGMNEIVAAAKGSGGRGKDYSVMKRAWTDTVWALALQARMQRFSGMVRLTFLWVEPNARRDKDNVAAGKKFVIDGLVTAKVLAADGWKIIAGFVDDFAIDPKRPGCLVTVTETRMDQELRRGRADR